MSDDDVISVVGLKRYVDRRRLREALASLDTEPALPKGHTRVVEPPALVAFGGETRVVTSPGAVAEPAGGAALPQRLGSYRIGGTAGAGGMGMVVRARRVEDVWATEQGGDVAIKLVRPEFARAPEFCERFVREAALP